MRSLYSYIYFIVYSFIKSFSVHVWLQVFLFNTNNLHRVLWLQVFPSNTNNLHTVLRLQVFLSNTNNLHAVLWLQIFVSNAYTNKCSNNYFYLIIFICLHTVVWLQVTNNNDHL